MINPHQLELPLSRTYLHSSIGVRAIEVRLYYTHFELGKNLILRFCLIIPISFSVIYITYSYELLMYSLRFYFALMYMEILNKKSYP